MNPAYQQPSTISDHCYQACNCQYFGPLSITWRCGYASWLSWGDKLGRPKLHQAEWLHRITTIGCTVSKLSTTTCNCQPFTRSTPGNYVSSATNHIKIINQTAMNHEPSWCFWLNHLAVARRSSSACCTKYRPKGKTCGASVNHSAPWEIHSGRNPAARDGYSQMIGCIAGQKHQ